jgi:Protein of unknown function (DUF2946)
MHKAVYMDEIVEKAMAKWPQVPACYGWLGLDARGNWYMRDDAVQACGWFDSGQFGAKGSVLRHSKLIEFIGRNYAADERGCWYFQNGPQRVYVELEAAPWVWRVNESGQVTSHTGMEVQITQAVVDEHGWLYAATQDGLGVVHSQDMEYAARAIEAGQWALGRAMRQDLERHYGWVRSPARFKM